MASAPARRLTHTPAFDGVRGVAILLVVAFHLQLLDPSLLGVVLPKGGSLGVDVFFVLSAFLITALLLREESERGSIRFGSFYRRRALRLLPALCLLVAADVVWAIIDHVPGGLERSSLLSVVLYYTNWKIVTAHSFPLIAPGLAHLWSLAVEEQFYIVWPLVLVLFLSLRRRTSMVAVAMLTAILIVMVARAELVHHTAVGILYFRTDMRADSLLVGALAAQLWVRHGSLSRRVLVPAAYAATIFIAACVALVSYQSKFLFDGGFTLFAVAVAVTLLAILETSWLPNRALSFGPLRAVGRVSYGLYLWHYFVFVVVAQHTGHWNAGLRIAFGLAIAVTATLLSWTLVEQPFLRWKDRLEHGSAEIAT